jgi:hypothetical protein
MFVTSASLVYTLYFGIISFIQLLIVIHSLEKKKKKKNYFYYFSKQRTVMIVDATNKPPDFEDP